MYNYYNKNIVFNNEPVYGLRYKNNLVYEYDQILKINNKLLNINDLSKNNIIKLFLNKVSEYMNIKKGTVMEYQLDLNKKITPDDLLNMTPQLIEILEHSINSHGKYYPTLEKNYAGKVINVQVNSTNNQ